MFEMALNELALDCELQTFENGEKLVNFIACDDFELPDIIFLDLNMPVLDGINALLRIRAMEKCAKVPPVVIYSTSSNETDVKKTFAAGANLYVTKPFDFQSIKNMLRSVLPQHALLASHTTEMKDFFVKAY